MRWYPWFNPRDESLRDDFGAKNLKRVYVGSNLQPFAMNMALPRIFIESGNLANALGNRKSSPAGSLYAH